LALIILLPALLCWAVLAMGTARKALLYVFLPVLLLLPQYYVLRVRHLPPITFADAAIAPLALAVLATELRRWRLAWMDLFVFLLAVAAGLSEALSAELANGDWVNVFSTSSAASLRLGINIANGGLMFVNALLTIVLPYMIGKTLLEQRDGDGVPMRSKVIRGMVSLLAIVALISVHDFVRGGVNIWQKLAGPLKPYQDEIWEPQVRWGFGRIAGPYGHAILAGMIFLMGIIYCLWLRRADPQWGARRLIAGLPMTPRGLILAALGAGLLMTQSRGPLIGVLLALVFAGLARILPAGKAALAFLVFLTFFGAAAYSIGKHYTNTDLNSATTEEQRNAVYRRELLRSYTPIIEERPAFGWGITDYPAMNGQQSIDNEYLLLVVTEGFFGLAVFLVVVGATAMRLLQFMTRPLEYEDRLLVFAHLSVLIGLMTTVTTVYMGEQIVVLFFMFIGWVQGLNPQLETAAVWQPDRPQAAFRRVLA
jgi:O-Antigen ligase